MKTIVCINLAKIRGCHQCFKKKKRMLLTGLVRVKIAQTWQSTTTNHIRRFLISLFIRRFLISWFIAFIMLLNFQYFNSTIHLLSYLYGYIWRSKSPHTLTLHCCFSIKCASISSSNVWNKRETVNINHWDFKFLIDENLKYPISPFMLRSILLSFLQQPLQSRLILITMQRIYSFRDIRKKMKPC